MNNMLTRALSGAVYVALIVCSILAGGVWFAALVAVFVALAILELRKLFTLQTPFSLVVSIVDIVASLCLLGALYAFNYGFNCYEPLCIMLILYIPLRVVLAVIDRGTSSLRSMLCSCLSMVYVTWPLAMLLIAYFLNGQKVVLATFVLIWLNDTGAYLSGRSFGRTKLCERLSPKKTWEGFWGGFCLCLAAGIFIAWLLGGETIDSYVLWGFYAAVVSVVGTFGDLFESMMKRTFGVKDSGNLIPGHGGILDRIDSLLPVSLFTALMALLLP